MNTCLHRMLRLIIRLVKMKMKENGSMIPMTLN